MGEAKIEEKSRRKRAYMLQARKRRWLIFHHIGGGSTISGTPDWRKGVGKVPLKKEKPKVKR